MFGTEVPTIQPADVAALVAEGWQLLDVRAPDEWAEGRIAGSVLIPMYELAERIDEVEDRVICVCAVGGRSARVAAYLNGNGREAVNLDGGVHGWAAHGLPVER